MSVLAVDRVWVDPPETFPISHLSVSSLNLFERCSYSWKRRYIDKVREPANGRMTRGKSAGAALAQHYSHQIETGEGLPLEAVLDEYSADWDERVDREPVSWGEEKPGELKDRGAQALAVYHRTIAPTIEPVAVERQFLLSWPDVPFEITGYIDLETAQDRVVDLKATDKAWGQDKADAELQPTVYLGARRAEGQPAAGFDFHLLVNTKEPKAVVVETERSERQLDLLTNRIFSIARAIEWRWREDCWAGTGPDVAWMCRGCGHREGCAWRRGT